MWEAHWHLIYSGNLKHEHQLLEKNSLNAVLWQQHCTPTPVVSKLQPELLGTTTNRTWGWICSDALQLATQAANTALCSFTVARRNTNPTAVWACRDAMALKDSPYHCWHCVGKHKVWKTFCYYVSIPQRNLPPASECNPYWTVVCPTMALATVFLASQNCSFVLLLVSDKYVK